MYGLTHLNVFYVIDWILCQKFTEATEALLQLTGILKTIMLKNNTNNAKKSSEHISSEKLSENDENVFSFKRYFINNLDSYHGEYLLTQITKVITDKNAASAPPSLTLIGEDAILEVPEPEQPYEIIGK